jgi:LDH2 family malate/lactate/ureidoglycolate dehydrogenase
VLKKLQTGKIIPEIEGLIFHPHVQCIARRGRRFGGWKGIGADRTHRTRRRVRGYAFFFWIVDPEIMLPGGKFPKRMAEYVQPVKGMPKQPGEDEIRIPSEHAYRERRRKEGILMDRNVVGAPKIIAANGMINYQ